jgi:GNAT superfamily N-acetyltransferase
VERTEVAEIEALRDNLAAAPAELADEFGISSLDLGGGALAVRVSSAPANNFLNHALGISTVAQLDALASFYGIAHHAVSPEPGVDLQAALLERGYEPGYAWMKFSRGTDDVPTPETDLEVVEIGPDRADDLGRTLAEGFGESPRVADWLAQLPGRDGWHCFVAYDGDEPAAGGALYVHEDTGWCGIAATRPELRRRGAQGAILAARIRRAAELGCTLVVTETGELVDDRPSNSYRNLLRAGFEPQYLRPNYVPKATDPGAVSQVKTTGSSRAA